MRPSCGIAPEQPCRVPCCCVLEREAQALENNRLLQLAYNARTIEQLAIVVRALAERVLKARQ